MTKPRSELTELEGAILGVVRRDPSCTAYRIRRIFLASRSAEWSGSAGAVYPAIRRMQTEGLVTERAEQDDERGTRTYRLSAKGKAVHDHWLCDVDRMVGSGLDPFRTRAGLWSVLPPAASKTLMKKLKGAIEKRRAELLEELPTLDEGDTIMAKLYVALLDVRLNWIEVRLGEKAPKVTRDLDTPI